MVGNMQLKFRKPYYLLSFSFWGLILCADQLLLPMFHLSGLPFKLSYFLAGYWFIDFLVRKNTNLYTDKEFKSFASAVMIIVFCSCIGALYFSVNWNVHSYEPLMRSILIYFLMILSFGLGLSALNFKFNWLISILIVALILNFAFIVFKFQMPQFLINLYYGEAVVSSKAGLGLTSARSILEMARPRGLFPNPNGSAFLVNIISLFLYLGSKNRLFSISKVWQYFVVILGPIILSMLLASRGEFVVAVILGTLHYRLVLKSSKAFARKLNALLVIGPLAVIGYGLQKLDMSDFQANIDRTLTVIEVVQNTGAGADQRTKELSSLARPLQVFLPAYERFKLSPIFGSGYGKVVGHPYFFEGTDYFHNDWFRILVTSGVIGFFVMLWIIYRFVSFLSWPVLIPFVLPGMVNSFLLNIPAVMFYFFMVGCLRSRIKRPPKVPT